MSNLFNKNNLSEIFQGLNTESSDVLPQYINIKNNYSESTSSFLPQRGGSFSLTSSARNTNKTNDDEVNQLISMLTSESQDKHNFSANSTATEELENRLRNMLQDGAGKKKSRKQKGGYLVENNLDPSIWECCQKIKSAGINVKLNDMTCSEYFKNKNNQSNKAAESNDLGDLVNSVTSSANNVLGVAVDLVSATSSALTEENVNNPTLVAKFHKNEPESDDILTAFVKGGIKVAKDVGNNVLKTVQNVATNIDEATGSTGIIAEPVKLVTNVIGDTSSEAVSLMGDIMDSSTSENKESVKHPQLGGAKKKASKKSKSTKKASRKSSRKGSRKGTKKMTGGAKKSRKASKKSKKASKKSKKASKKMTGRGKKNN